jgi:hypothetical protein
MRLGTLLGVLVGGLAMSWASRRRRPFDDVGGFFSDEPEVARMVTVDESASGFTIPDPGAGSSDHHVQGIHAPGLINGSRAVMFFRTTHTQRPSFSVRLNSTQVMQQTLSDGGPHSWHRIMPAVALMTENNELAFAVTGDGAVTFFDVVILYRSNKLTVKRPVVLTQR